MLVFEEGNSFTLSEAKYARRKPHGTNGVNFFRANNLREDLQDLRREEAVQPIPNNWH